MGIDLPGTFGNPHTTLPAKLDIQSLVLLILIGYDGLLISALKSVAVGVVPGARLVGLVVGELTLIKSSVGKHPSTLSDGVVFPLSNEFHAGLIVGVGAFTLLFPEHPPSRIRVLIRIDIRALAMLDAILPLPYTITKKHYHSTLPSPYTSASLYRAYCCS